jgi:hypothetical protein
VREVLVQDGGLEQLIRILKAHAFIPDASSALPDDVETVQQSANQSQWIWSLAFHCLSHVGIRGTEQIRTRVMDAGGVGIIISVLSGWLRQNRLRDREDAAPTGQENLLLNQWLEGAIRGVPMRRELNPGLPVVTQMPVVQPVQAEEEAAPSPQEHAGVVALQTLPDAAFMEASTRHRVQQQHQFERDLAMAAAASEALASMDPVQSRQVRHNLPTLLHESLHLQARNDTTTQAQAYQQLLQYNMTPRVPDDIPNVNDVHPSVQPQLSPRMLHTTVLPSEMVRSSRPRRLELGALSNLSRVPRIARMPLMDNASPISMRSTLSPAVQRLNHVLGHRAPAAVPLLSSPVFPPSEYAQSPGPQMDAKRKTKTIVRTYREEDCLQSLQILAYLSKYPHLRRRLRADYAPLDVFGLVERFCGRHNPAELQYWAGIVMRNGCRKDEVPSAGAGSEEESTSSSALRQCARIGCGKTESHPREFAKCRRCRKAKYCSKECQSRAWADGHKYWCMERPPTSTTNEATIRPVDAVNATTSAAVGPMPVAVVVDEQRAENDRTEALLQDQRV